MGRYAAVGVYAPPEQRFWRKVEKTTGCWLWTGALSGGTGYGSFWADGRHVLAHRFAYEVEVGAIPEGMQIDHLCRVRRCVRPDHLEAVSQRENIRRSEALSARLARANVCKRGHSLTGSNLYVAKSGRRHCINCRNWRRRMRNAGLWPVRSVGAAS